MDAGQKSDFLCIQANEKTKSQEIDQEYEVPDHQPNNAFLLYEKEYGTVTKEIMVTTTENADSTAVTWKSVPPALQKFIDKHDMHNQVKDPLNTLRSAVALFMSRDEER